ncbi:MAG: 5-formyltetrahydrofolate cyclo-ligase [Rikenellaceae bacterium]
MSKATIRAKIKSLNLAIDEQERRAAAEVLSERILAHPCVRSAQRIALFSSLRDEIDTSVLIEQLAGDKHLLLPRVVGDEMEFVSLGESLQSGSFGILEPAAGEAIPYSEIDLMIVPAVAYTANGDRLGRGKGYYDRYLTQGKIRTIGVAYSHQIVTGLPTEPHDVQIDEVIAISL